MPQVSLDAQLFVQFKQQDKNRIRNGRQIIDNYRSAHNAMVVNGVKVANDDLDILVNAYNLLIQDERFYSLSPTEALDKFFYYSTLLNVNELGYQLIEDFRENATPEEKAELETMWK